MLIMIVITGTFWFLAVFQGAHKEKRPIFSYIRIIRQESRRIVLPVIGVKDIYIVNTVGRTK